MFLQKTFEKWEKNNPSWACPCRIEKFHPCIQNLTRESASLVPGQYSNPSGEISLSYMDTHGECYNLTWVKTVEIPIWCGIISLMKTGLVALL